MSWRSYKINFKYRWSFNFKVWNIFWQNLEADLIDLFAAFASFNSSLSDDLEEIKDDVISIIPNLMRNKMGG